MTLSAIFFLGLKVSVKCSLVKSAPCLLIVLCKSSSNLLSWWVNCLDSTLASPRLIIGLLLLKFQLLGFILNFVDI